MTAPYFTQLWTVAVEFQFYLIFPFIKRFFDAYGARYIFGFLILVVVLRFMVFTIDGTVQDLAYWTIFGKIDQFLIGMLIGDLYCRKSGICNNPAYFLAALALVFLCMQWMDNHGGFYGFHGSGYPSKAGWWVLWPTVEGSMWGFFTLTYLNSRWTLGKGVEASLARVGATSFSMYVMHWFVMSAVEKTVGLPNVTGNNVIDALLLGGFVVLPATVALSAATYWIIERPFLVLRKRYVAPKPIVAHV